MKFINKNKPVQVRIKETLGFRWKSVKTNEIVDLPESVGKANGFEKVLDINESKIKVTEGKIGKKIVETKQFKEKKNEEFYKQLREIKGIGKKTAKDIIEVFPTKKELKKAISNKKGLPFRDDVEQLLRRSYGKN